MKLYSSAFMFIVVAIDASTTGDKDQENEKVGLRGGDGNHVHSEKYQDSNYIEDNVERRLTGTADEPPHTHRVIVRYKPGSHSKVVQTIATSDSMRRANQAMTEIHYDFTELDTMVITADPAIIVEMQNITEIESIEADPLRFPARNPKDFVDFVQRGSRNLQQTKPYGVDLVQAPDAWERGATGQGVKVCVIDSGIDVDHPDFVTSRLGGLDTSLDWNTDGCGHGTHVAGTIAGMDDNGGVIGVSPDAEIFVVRVFGNSCGYAYASGIYDAARQCKSNGAKIVSMSLGGPRSSFLERSGFESLYQDGILLVAAAGNDGNTAKSYPASYDSVVSVAALNEYKDHASFSQRNDQVDIAAPGVNILSTFPVGGCTICGINTGGFGSIDGTSMATPHVSGVAALLWSVNPSASAVEIRIAMELSAEDLGSSGRDDTFGYGLVRAGSALQYLENGSTESDGDSSIIDDNNSCTDYPTAWHDSDGSKYDCAWYAASETCDQYGNGFKFEGYTANDACCICGGGVTSTPPPTGCTDFPAEWFDLDGSDFDCEWYSQSSNCQVHGDGFSNEGYNANEACCVCGGGDNGDGSLKPSSPPTSLKPSSPPTEAETCSDSPDWLDSEDYDCEFYAQKSNCEYYGEQFEKAGLTANQACCACGGGSL